MRLRNGKQQAVKPALPLPYPTLAAAGVRVRPAQMSLTVAAPGAGKSQLWLNIAMRMHRPALYFSADTDQADVTARAIALWLDLPTVEVEQNLLDPGYRKWMFEQTNHLTAHVEFVFDNKITPTGVEQRMDAFAEVHGMYPELTVLDNVSNTIENTADEYAEIKEVMAGCQTVARDSGAHVALLHHAKGQYEDTTLPIPQSGASQNPFKLPELGLTIHRPQDGWIGVNVVKNRSGASDPKAQNAIFLPIDFGKSSVYGFERAA